MYLSLLYSNLSRSLAIESYSLSLSLSAARSFVGSSFERVRESSTST
jgi:hypothetical protein